MEKTDGAEVREAVRASEKGEYIGKTAPLSAGEQTTAEASD